MTGDRDGVLRCGKARAAASFVTLLSMVAGTVLVGAPAAAAPSSPVPSVAVDLLDGASTSALPEPVATQSFESTALATGGTAVATVVQTVGGSTLDPQSPDSAGLTWMPSQGRLLMSDSEINEYSYYGGTNLWSMTTTKPPAVTGRGNTLKWSREPTGVAFDPNRNRLYTSDDNSKRIYEVVIGADQVPGTSDDVVVRSFDTTAFGYLDPEGLTIDTTRGRMHAVDGSNSEVFTIDAGPNGVFEGGNDDVISHFDVRVDGVRDPEGIAYDAVHDTITVIDYRTTVATEYSVDGRLRRYIDLGAGGLVHPAGGTWAPSSTGSGNSLWVVDRGADGASPVDGKLVEFAVPPLSGEPPPPDVPDVSVSSESVAFGQVVAGGSAERDVVVSNVGSGSLAVSSTVVSGPDAGRFSIVSGGGAFTLAPGASRTVKVRFSPLTEGTFSASLTVVSDDPDEGSVPVALSGSGVTEAPTTGAVTATATYQGGSAAVSSVSTSVPVAGVRDRLYVAYVSTKGNVAVTSVSGLGAAWSPVAAQCGARSQTGVAAFATTSASASSVVTAAMAGSPSNAALAVVEYAGVDLSSPFGAKSSFNTNGVAGGCTGGTDSASYSVDLPVTAGSMVVGAVNGRHRSHTAGDGFVERVELVQGTGGSATSISVEDRISAATGTAKVNGTLAGNADWSAVALEIRSGSGGPPPPPPPPEVPDISIPGSVSFGQVVAGGSADRDVVVSNVGPGPLSVTSTGISGTNAGRFSVVSGGGAFTLAAGASRAVTVRFSPSVEGSFSAALDFVSNDPDEASASTSLSGSGVVEQPPSGAVEVTGTHEGGSSGSNTVSTSAPVPVVADRLYVAFVTTKGNTAVTGVSGLGAAWSPVSAQCGGRNQTGIAVFATTSASASSVVTATMAAGPSSAAVAVVEYSGVDLTTPFGSTTSFNTNGVAGGCSGGTDSAAYSVALAVSAGSMVVGAVNGRHRSHTAGDGFVERLEFVQGSGGSASSVAVEDRSAPASGNVTVDGTLAGSADWSAVALEIRPRRP